MLPQLGWLGPLNCRHSAYTSSVLQGKVDLSPPFQSHVLFYFPFLLAANQPSCLENSQISPRFPSPWQSPHYHPAQCFWGSQSFWECWCSLLSCLSLLLSWDSPLHVSWAPPMACFSPCLSLSLGHLLMPPFIEWDGPPGKQEVFLGIQGIYIINVLDYTKSGDLE